ncbi:hypothetical protein P691DRAFT_648585, partial [Macrolepiota fuliginosa MF-IS2]
TPLKCLYILCRYLPLALWPLIIWTIVLDHTQEECIAQGALIWENITFLILVRLSPLPCVLAIRAYAYTGRRKTVRILLTLCICTYFGVQLWAY